MNDQKPQDSAVPMSAASGLSDGLERMFRVAKTDHPDLVGGIVWADCELAWINERITLAILAEREACAKICDDLHSNWQCGPKECAEAIRMRSNVRSQATDAALSRQVACTDGLCPGANNGESA